MNGNKHLLRAVGKAPPSCLQIHLYIAYEALELEEHGHNEVDGDSSMLEESPRSGQLIPCIVTAFMKKIQKVIVIAVPSEGKKGPNLVTKPNF